MTITTLYGNRLLPIKIMQKEYALLYPKPDGTLEAIIGRPFNLILKEAREKKGIGIRELSRNAECSHVYLMKIERGERTPAPKLLSKLQRALNLDPFLLVPQEELGLKGDEIVFVGEPESTKKTPEQQQTHLLGSLIECLKRGGFKPSLGAANEQEKEVGVTYKITLGIDQELEVLIKKSN